MCKNLTHIFYSVSEQAEEEKVMQRSEAEEQNEQEERIDSAVRSMRVKSDTQEVTLHLYQPVFGSEPQKPAGVPADMAQLRSGHILFSQTHCTDTASHPPQKQKERKDATRCQDGQQTIII